MFNVCPSCGEYRPDREIRGPEQIAVCPCGDVQPFRAAPLFLVGGASGTGKSTVLVPLARQTLPVVPLESDILWRDAFRQRTDEFTETWLRMAKSIGMAGKPVMLFGAGLVVPDNVEDSVERRYFSVVHRLAFVCDAQILAARLRARPAWRGSAEPAMLEQQIGFNRWLQEHGPSEGMTLVDTSTISVGDASKRVLAWVEARLRS